MKTNKQTKTKRPGYRFLHHLFYSWDIAVVCSPCYKPLREMDKSAAKLK